MENIKKKLLEFGMEQTDIDELCKDVYSGYVTKETYDVLQGQVKVYEDKSNELSNTIKELQKEADVNEALKLKLNDLEGRLSDKDKEIEKVKFDYKLESKMKEVGAKNIKAIKALIDMEQVKLEDGELIGFDNQIETLKETDGYLFEDTTNRGSLGSTGNHNRGNNVKNPFTKEHFNLTEQSKLYMENPVLAKQLEELARG